MQSTKDNNERQAAHLNAERLIRIGSDRDVVEKSFVERGFSEDEAKKKVDEMLIVKFEISRKISKRNMLLGGGALLVGIFIGILTSGSSTYVVMIGLLIYGFIQFSYGVFQFTKLERHEVQDFSGITELVKKANESTDE